VAKPASILTQTAAPIRLEKHQPGAWASHPMPKAQALALNWAGPVRLAVGGRALPALLNRFHHLLGDLRVQRGAGVKRYHYPPLALGVDPMTAFCAQSLESRFQHHRLRLGRGQARQFRHRLRLRW
jgi:hypothetical protein